MAKRVNYLNNKDMLAEIHKSKTSFCYYTNKNYTDFDVIVHDITEINNEIIQIAREGAKGKCDVCIVDEMPNPASLLPYIPHPGLLWR